MTDAKKIVAYKAAYKDLLAQFFDYYNMTKVFDTYFCECCPIGAYDCDFDYFDSHRCGEKILASYTEDINQ